MPLPICVVERVHRPAVLGQPAAVVRLAEGPWPDPTWLQAVAAELRLSETAFVVPRPDLGASEFDLRWFTPTVEVDLCGHATLATTHALGRDGAVRFHTRSGVLSCVRHADGLIEMDFPGDRLSTASHTITLTKVLNTNDLYEVAIGRFLVVELGSAADVRSLTPDMGGVPALHEHGVIVTAPGDRAGIDVVSRVFVPRMGIPEDPVTGSAHCTLAGFWSNDSDATGSSPSRRPPGAASSTSASPASGWCSGAGPSRSGPATCTPEPGIRSAPRHRPTTGRARPVRARPAPVIER